MSDFQALADFFRYFEQPVAVLDLETTGGRAGYDRITEIAFLHFAQGTITAVSQLVNPQIPISPFIENLTGISNAMVADAPTFDQVLPDILPLLRGSLIIAHNSRFDYPFLRHECRRAGTDFAASALCSVQLSRRLYPGQRSHSLDALIARHGLAGDSRHRAMGDVRALTQFLETALHECGAVAWLQEAKQLASPPLPPADLSDTLRHTLKLLPDGHGVSLWYNADGSVSRLHVHEQAYRETAALLHKHRPARIEFTPAVGPLHAQIERIHLMRQHRLPLLEKSIRHTIRFQPDPRSGCLNARIRPLEPGFYDTPPSGLFMHPKAAKRALSDWAKQHNICPALLGILPDTPPQGAPCPVSLVRNCSPACRDQDIAAHNRSVQAAAKYLPVCDWWDQSRLTVRETDPASGVSMEFLCDSGAVLLPDNQWYSDAPLLEVLKNKSRQDKKTARAAAA